MAQIIVDGVVPGTERQRFFLGQDLGRELDHALGEIHQRHGRVPDYTHRPVSFANYPKGSDPVPAAASGLTITVSVNGRLRKLVTQEEEGEVIARLCGVVHAHWPEVQVRGELI